MHWNKLFLIRKRFICPLLKKEEKKRERRNKRLYYILKCYVDKIVITKKFDVWKHYLSEIRRHEEEKMESIASTKTKLPKNMHHERLQETSGTAIVFSNKLSLLQNFVKSFIKRRRRRRRRRENREAKGFIIYFEVTLINVTLARSLVPGYTVCLRLGEKRRKI